MSKLLTGATGALGANIIDSLRKDPSVSKILCLVRAKDEQESRTRVEACLAARRISINDTDHCEIKCMPYRLDETDLGLPADTLEQIRTHVTSFIHASTPKITV